MSIINSQNKRNYLNGIAGCAKGEATSLWLVASLEKHLIRSRILPPPKRVYSQGDGHMIPYLDFNFNQVMVTPAQSGLIGAYPAMPIIPIEK